MARLDEIVEFLDSELKIAEVPDYSAAMNGLQLQNAGSVQKVVAAVDASLPVIQKAVSLGADLLVVHHGMFWQGAQKVTGAVYEKLKLAIEHGLAIYSAHIPLDVHPKWGNNVQLAQAIGMDDPEPFFDWKGIQLGLCQKMTKSRQELLQSLTQAVGSPVHLCSAGSDEVGVVGIITGGAGSEVASVAQCGIQTFITGEGPHWSYPLAEELQVNLFYAGHYATETFGVKVLTSELAHRFDIVSDFIDHPTGL